MTKIGNFINTFEYIGSNGGVDTEISYPYLAKDGICMFNKSDVGATMTSFGGIPQGNETELHDTSPYNSWPNLCRYPCQP